MPVGWILYTSQHLSLDSNISLERNENHSVGYNNVLRIYMSDDSLKTIAYSLLATPRHANRILSATRLDGQKVIAKRYTIYADCKAETLGEIVFFIYTDRINELALKNYFMDEVFIHVNCINKKIIKQKTKDIVRMFALGLDRNEISELFNLSRRGVDYHIDLAKNILGASNKSSVIFLAMNQGWLTEHQHDNRLM